MAAEGKAQQPEMAEASPLPPDRQAAKRSFSDMTLRTTIKGPSGSLRASTESLSSSSSSLSSSSSAYCPPKKKRKRSGQTKAEKARLQEQLEVEKMHLARLDVRDPLALVRSSSPAHLSLNRDLCDVCNTHATPDMPMLFCTECNESTHALCAGVDGLVLASNSGALRAWKCPTCVVCVVCARVGREDQLLVCDWCQLGYHTYCLDPPLRSLPLADKWLCHGCASCPVPYCSAQVEGAAWLEQVRHAGLVVPSHHTPSSPSPVSYGEVGDARGQAGKEATGREEATGRRREWEIAGTGKTMQQYWGAPVCGACVGRYANRQFCQVCLDVYDEDDYGLQMVCCDSCDQWIHTQCLRMSTREYHALTRAIKAAGGEEAEEVQFHCPKCKGEEEEPPVRSRPPICRFPASLPSASLPPSPSVAALAAYGQVRVFGGPVAETKRRGRRRRSGRQTAAPPTPAVSAEEKRARQAVERVAEAAVEADANGPTCALCPSEEPVATCGLAELLAEILGRDRLFPFASGGVFAHVVCASVASGTSVGVDGDIYGLGKALSRSRRLSCSACGAGGATLGCYRPSCKYIAHLRCCLPHGCRLYSTVAAADLSSRPFGALAMLCPDHAAGAPKKWLPIGRRELAGMTASMGRKGMLDGKAKRFGSMADGGEKAARIGALALLATGDLAQVDREAMTRYATRHRVFPVGYEAVRRFSSARAPGGRTTLCLSVEEGPEFVLREKLEGEEVLEVRAATPAGAWLLYLEHLRGEGLMPVTLDLAVLLPKLLAEHEMAVKLQEAVVRVNGDLDLLMEAEDEDEEKKEKETEVKEKEEEKDKDKEKEKEEEKDKEKEKEVAGCQQVREWELRLLVGVGAKLFGLGEAWVCREVEHFASGLRGCRQYHFWHNAALQRLSAPLPLNRSGCARAEPMARRKKRQKFRISSALAGDDQQASGKKSSGGGGGGGGGVGVHGRTLPYSMQYRQLKNAAEAKIRVGRSKIQGFGVFAIKDIAQGEMIVEYIGQIIRQSVADLREKRYEAKGVGCYMFRLTDDEILDATFTGNIARYINHSCEPNASTRKISVGGEYKIVIYALRDISVGQEISYDYKFPIEEEKIPCHCGAKKCRRTMN